MAQIYRPDNRARQFVYLAGRSLHRVVPSPTRYTGSGIEELGDLAATSELAVVTHHSRPREIIVAKGRGRVGILAKIGRGSDRSLLARESILPAAAERLSRSSVAVPMLLESWSITNGQIVVQALVEDAEAPKRDELRDLLLRSVLSLAEADLTHGDLAPWNLLVTPAGPLLIDWEFSSSEHVPALDLTHFLIQAAVLGRWWNPEEVVAMLLGAGSLGAAYGRSLGLSEEELVDAILFQLENPPAASASSAAADDFRSDVGRRIRQLAQ